MDAITAGQPRKFNEDNLIEYWRVYCGDIAEGGFRRLPTQTNMCRWLSAQGISVDRKTLYNSLNKYFPNIKNEWNSILADTLTEGAALGKYNSTTVIFCLKNWCGWGDGVQQMDIKQSSEVTASSQLLKALLDDNTKRE